MPLTKHDRQSLGERGANSEELKPETWPGSARGPISIRNKFATLARQNPSIAKPTQLTANIDEVIAAKATTALTDRAIGPPNCMQCTNSVEGALPNQGKNLIRTDFQSHCDRAAIGQAAFA